MIVEAKKLSETLILALLEFLASMW